jgi:RNase P subunit RPR2
MRCQTCNDRPGKRVTVEVDAPASNHTLVMCSQCAESFAAEARIRVTETAPR